ncbi:MAG: 3-dehydroquinate synthase [Firmicutes bacterium]|nr:3-dehydroquinate synthase [Bacillota bacterium]
MGLSAAGGVRLALVGLSGSGKGSVGRLLARRLDVACLDLDRLVELEAGAPVRHIWAEEGEQGFRRREAAALERALELGEAVLATGGGTPLLPGAMDRLVAWGRVVWLDAPPEVLAARLGEEEVAGRPLFAGRLPAEVLRAQLAARRAVYARALRIDAAAAPAEVAERVLAAAGLRPAERPSAVRRLSVGGAYEVEVSDAAPERLADWLAGAGAERLVLLAEPLAGALAGGEILEACRARGLQAELLLFPGGEEAKRLVTVERLYHELVRRGVERTTWLLAVGGGVTTDLGGFVAATFLRGLPWVAVPTTLLAQVDAAIGGKTGVDLEEGKNLVGAFYPPRRVVADVRWLRALPRQLLLEGMGEVVKAALLAGEPFWSWLEEARPALLAREPEALAEAVARAAAVKAEVVAADEREAGRRELLNLGHTFAHALEWASGYRLRHGEAVATGLFLAARRAEAEGLLPAAERRRIEALLEAYGIGRSAALPRGEASSPDRLAAALAVDKKRRHGRLRLVLPRAVGDVVAGWPAETEELARWLASALERLSWEGEKPTGRG